MRKYSQLIFYGDIMNEILNRGFAELGIEVPDSACRNLKTYFEYLEEKNKVMNLTAISGEEDVARLHFLDCAAMLKVLDLKGKRVIDVGTGAGFPGMVLKILSPDTELVLLDSLNKRIDFLSEVCEKLSLEKVSCIHARAEEAAAEMGGTFDLAASRAVARLNVLCELCLPFVKVGGVFAAMKGPDCTEELKEAENAIKLLGGRVREVVPYTIPDTDITHSIVIIEKLKPTHPKYPRKWAQIKKQPL